MLFERRTIAEEYPRALSVAVGQIAVVLLLTALVLDGGLLFRAALAAILPYLGMLAVIVVRRPDRPSSGDLVAIKSGYLLALFTFVVPQILAHSAT